MHSTVCTVIDLFMCVCHILLINYYYYDSCQPAEFVKTVQHETQSSGYTA